MARAVQKEEKGLERKGLGPLCRCSHIFTEMDLRGFRGNLWGSNYHVRLGLLFYAWMDQKSILQNWISLTYADQTFRFGS